MFQQMKNIDTAFRYVRLFSVIVILISAAVSAYSLYLSFSMVSHAGQKVFILANGKALEAYAADRKDNIPVEAKDHVKLKQKFMSN